MQGKNKAIKRSFPWGILESRHIRQKLNSAIINMFKKLKGTISLERTKEECENDVSTKIKYQENFSKGQIETLESKSTKTEVKFSKNTKQQDSAGRRKKALNLKIEQLRFFHSEKQTEEKNEEKLTRFWDLWDTIKNANENIMRDRRGDYKAEKIFKEIIAENINLVKNISPHIQKAQ